MKFRRLFSVGLLAAMVVGAGPVNAPAAEAPTRVVVPGGTYTNVSPLLLQKMLEQKDFFFVNVHIPYEGEIARTDAHIPFDQVETLIRQFPSNKDAKLLLYCQSGRMSDIAARTLVRLGYTNLWHLQGGMIDWQQQGYPLLDSPKK